MLGRPEELMDKGIFIGAGGSRLKRDFILPLACGSGVQMHSGASGAPHRCASKSFLCPGFKPLGWFRRRRCSGARRHLSGIGGSCRTNWRTNSHSGSFTRSFIWRAGDLGRWALNNNAHVVLAGRHFIEKRREKKGVSKVNLS